MPVNSYIGHLQFRIERNPTNEQEPVERQRKWGPCIIEQPRTQAGLELAETVSSLPRQPPKFATSCHNGARGGWRCEVTFCVASTDADGAH